VHDATIRLFQIENELKRDALNKTQRQALRAEEERLLKTKEVSEAIIRVRKRAEEEIRGLEAERLLRSGKETGKENVLRQQAVLGRIKQLERLQVQEKKITEQIAFFKATKNAAEVAKWERKQRDVQNTRKQVLQKAAAVAGIPATGPPEAQVAALKRVAAPEIERVKQRLTTEQLEGILRKARITEARPEGERVKGLEGLTPMQLEQLKAYSESGAGAARFGVGRRGGVGAMDFNIFMGDLQRMIQREFVKRAVEAREEEKTEEARGLLARRAPLRAEPSQINVALQVDGKTLAKAVDVTKTKSRTEDGKTVTAGAAS
jgi:hypothetical protein